MNGKRTPMAAGEMRPARISRAGFVVPVLVAALAFGALACTQSAPPQAKTPEELLAQLKNDRARIDQTTDEMMKKIDQFNASRKPGQETLQFSEIFSQDLSPEQKDVLNSMVQEEKDVSYKALLQKIIADRETIQGLQQNVMKLEQSLPDKFVVVKRGDRQADLAMAYLTQEAHLDSAKAESLLARVDQTDELLVGNKVWFFYDPRQDTFRTYVTQGEAGQTPLAVRRARSRKLIQERDALKGERDTLQGERDTAQAEVASLQQTKADLQSDIEDLSQKKADLESTVDRLSRDIAFHENSLFYHADNEKALKEQGVLSSILKRVRDVKGVQFNEALDLRQSTTLTLRPADFGLSEIRDVRVLPPIYQEGRDFTVQTDKDHSGAKLVILDPDLFRGKQILLAIRG